MGETDLGSTIEQSPYGLIYEEICNMLRFVSPGTSKLPAVDIECFYLVNNISLDPASLEQIYSIIQNTIITVITHRLEIEPARLSKIILSATQSCITQGRNERLRVAALPGSIQTTNGFVIDPDLLLARVPDIDYPDTIEAFPPEQLALYQEEWPLRFQPLTVWQHQDGDITQYAVPNPTFKVLLANGILEEKKILNELPGRFNAIPWSLIRLQMYTPRPSKNNKPGEV